MCPKLKNLELDESLPASLFDIELYPQMFKHFVALKRGGNNIDYSHRWVNGNKRKTLTYYSKMIMKFLFKNDN